MVNPTYGQVVVKSSQLGLWGILKLLIKFGFWGIIIGVLFVGSIAKGIQARDPLVTIYDIGGKIFLVTTKADTVSQDIITNGLGFVSFFQLFTSIVILYMWFKLFARLYGWSPLSNSSNIFINWTLSFLTVTTILSIISLAHASVLGNVTSFFTSNTSVIHYLVTPFRSYWNIILAITSLILPISEKVESLYIKS